MKPDHPGHHGDHAGHGDHGDPTEMVRAMREKWLWTNLTIISLGVWLISTPFTFGQASRAMVWSDVLSGGLLVFLPRQQNLWVASGSGRSPRA